MFKLLLKELRENRDREGGRREWSIHEKKEWSKGSRESISNFGV